MGDSYVVGPYTEFFSRGREGMILLYMFSLPVCLVVLPVIVGIQLIRFMLIGISGGQ